MMAYHKFWKLRTANSSWHIECSNNAWSWGITASLRIGATARNWPSPPPRFVYKRPPKFTDLPIPLHHYSIISDRFRRLLEVSAPGAAEYLPIRLDGPGSGKLGPYWMVNWLRLFDCLDEKESVIDIGQDGVRRIMFPCIEPRRVPADGVLGLLRGHDVVVLVRDDLCKSIKKAGITGFAVGPIAHSVEPGRTLTASGASTTTTKQSAPKRTASTKRSSVKPKKADQRHADHTRRREQDCGRSGCQHSAPA